MKIIIGIYKFTSPSSKSYVGQSIDIFKRKNIHKGKYEDFKLCRSFKKYGFEAHTFEILEECPLEQLNEREIYYKQLELNKVDGDWQKVLFHELYDTGGGPKSKETCLKIGEAKRGHDCYKNPERGEKISKALKGRKIIWKAGWTKGKKKPIGFGEKITISKIGKKQSEKTCQKKRESMKGKQTRLNIGESVIQFSLENKFINEFPAALSAGRFLGVNGSSISACAIGKQKTAYGFKWKYKKDL